MQADSDDRLIGLWLAGKADRTRRAYQDDVAAFLRFVGKELRQVTLADLVAWGETLSGMAPASRARKLGAVKLLAAFGHRIGYLAFDIGAPLRLPAVKTTLAERILGAGDVLRLLTLETNPRNHALLRLLYAGALRVSELCALTWRDLQQKGGHLTPVQVHRIVKQSAARAGISEATSAHWLRHAHASHALDRGAPVSFVQATLGHASVATTGRYLHARPNDSSARYLPG